jgi:hypothetical protein
VKKKLSCAAHKKFELRFLLARLHIDSLKRKRNVVAVLNTLESLPETVDDMYHDAWKRIESQYEDDREIGKRVLCWVIFAFRPLSIVELQHALSIVPGMRKMDMREIIFEECLTSFCAGLVIVDDKGMIRLVRKYRYDDDKKN